MYTHVIVSGCCLGNMCIFPFFLYPYLSFFQFIHPSTHYPIIPTDPDLQYLPFLLMITSFSQ